MLAPSGAQRTMKMAETLCRSRQALTMAHTRSSHRDVTGRAPRLRRIAEIVEQQADTARFPDRARRVARDMRLRAAELELGELRPSAQEEINELLEFMAAA